MLQKIIDPLKLFIIGAIVAALIVLGFQLGKQTNKGLLAYLQQEKTSLEKELKRVQQEHLLLLSQKAKTDEDAVQAAAEKTDTTESGNTPSGQQQSAVTPAAADSTPPEQPAPAPATAEQPKPAIDQITNVFAQPDTQPATD